MLLKVKRFFSIILSIGVITAIQSCKAQEQNSSPTPTTQPKTVSGVKGVWLTNVVSQALYTKEGIKQAVDLCSKSGINHIFVVTWNKGRTLYPSKIMNDLFKIPIEETLAGRDPLREIIDEAHAKNIKVYAWFEYGFAAENSGFGEHILRIKPQWASLDKNGNITTKNGFKWLNALNPEVQDFMLSLLKEAVVNYPDLDGIQGDDRLPAMAVEGGYNPEILSQYKAETGSSPSSDKEENWVNWRANRLNKFMEKLSVELKKINPKIGISMAPSIFPFAKTEYLQDWPTWVNNGWVDMICPQIYRYDIVAYKAELAKIINTQINADKVKLLAPGVLLKVGTYKPTYDYLKQMIDENRRNKIDNEVFFFYEGLKDNSLYFTTEYAK
ncbi:MAG: glycoside hydrolase family 10 protein [Emticicia sp.]|uniref:glycoside hydrolase family 10 protein n=1 Tax=Emticicia sp. TaxID=1930953 RepID=UPI003BA6C720